METIKLILNSEKQYKLIQFMQESHGEQKRKYTHEPYWHHPVTVASILQEKVPRLKFSLEIAICHDLLEDTDVTEKGLFAYLKIIGYSLLDSHSIVKGVISLTDVFTKENYPDMNRIQRKKLEAERLSTVNHVAQTVKYADLIHNTSSIVEHDKKFAKFYIEEKRNMLVRMRIGDRNLRDECWKCLIAAEEELSRKGIF